MIILVYILSRIDWPQMRSTIDKANLFFIITALILNIPLVWFKSTRWQLLLAMQGHSIKNRDSFLFYSSAIFLGEITPGRLGEFVKAIYLKQAGITNTARGFSSVLFDRLFDFFLLFILAMSGLITIAPWQNAYIFGWAGILCAGGMPLLFLFSDKTERLISLFYRKILAPKIPEGTQDGVEQFAKGFRKLISRRLWQAGILTCISYALFFFQCFLIAKGLGMPLSYLEIILVMAMTNIFTLLPISISGIGTREAALLALLRPFGMSLELIFAYSIGVLLVFFIGIGIIGAYAWWVKPFSLSR